MRHRGSTGSLLCPRLVPLEGIRMADLQEHHRCGPNSQESVHAIPSLHRPPQIRLFRLLGILPTARPRRTHIRPSREDLDHCRDAPHPPPAHLCGMGGPT